MAKRPDSAALHTAADWLDVNEGDEEGNECHRVATWLRAQADAQDLRTIAKNAGSPVEIVRKALKRARPATEQKDN